MLALRGLDSQFIEAYLDTLEPLAIPEHVGSYHVEGHHPGFALVVPDPEEHVVALWDAPTGAMTEIYRGPASGETTIVIPRGNWWLDLADGRILSSLDLDGDNDEKEIALADPTPAITRSWSNGQLIGRTSRASVSCTSTSRRPSRASGPCRFRRGDRRADGGGGAGPGLERQHVGEIVCWGARSPTASARSIARRRSARPVA